MAVYIELTTDPFEANYTRLKAKNDPSVSRSGRAGLSNVRRPLRGLEVKDDTYGSLKVIRADGSELPFMDSSSATGRSTSYSNFIIQNVREARMEKHQIVETFGDSYIYFFGEAPRFLDVQAVLINSQDFNWEAEWWANWDRTLRGSKSVDNGARTYLFYDDNVVEGYMLMSEATKASTEPFMVTMSFRMFVASARNVSFVGDPNFPVADSVYLPPSVDLGSADAFDQLRDGYQDALEDGAQQANYDNEVNRLASQGQQGVLGANRRLTDALNIGTRSVAFPATVQAYIDSLRASNAQDTSDIDLIDRLTSHPLRSLIADNRDEYTGSGSTNVDYLQDFLPEVYDPRVRTQLEVEDLFHSAISWMACFGANLNSSSLLGAVGMGVAFGGGGGVGIGLGASSGLGIGFGATFGATPRAGVGYGGNTGRGVGFSGSLSFSAGAGGAYVPSGSAGSVSALNSNRGLAGQAFNPYLANQPGSTLFGAGAAAGVSNDPVTGTTGTFAEAWAGKGDPAYGYTSPYGGPGFGRAGFGDFGGLGFGASFGATGDPGYLPPDKFTFAGLPSDQGALKRLVQSNPGIGIGLGGIPLDESSPGVGSGASISVGGSISAFAIAAVPGNLDPSGHTLANPYQADCLNNVTVGLRVSLGSLL